MATTEKQTQYKPVSSMTLADLNRRNQTFHDSGGQDAGSLQPKEAQLEPGTTVHNSRGSRGKVIRVQGSRVVVRTPEGEDVWDLTKTYPAAETADAEKPVELSLEEAKALLARRKNPHVPEPDEPGLKTGYVFKKSKDDFLATENLREATEQFISEENQEPVHATGGAEAFGEALEELLDEEEQEPEHQTDAVVKRPWLPEDERLYQEQVVKPGRIERKLERARERTNPKPEHRGDAATSLTPEQIAANRERDKAEWARIRQEHNETQAYAKANPTRRGGFPNDPSRGALHRGHDDASRFPGHTMEQATRPGMPKATPAVEVAQRIKEKEASQGLTSTSSYQNMRAELYMNQHPGVSKEEALKIVNSR